MSDYKLIYVHDRIGVTYVYRIHFVCEHFLTVCVLGNVSL